MAMVKLTVIMENGDTRIRVREVLHTSKAGEVAAEMARKAVRNFPKGRAEQKDGFSE